MKLFSGLIEKYHTLFDEKGARGVVDTIEDLKRSNLIVKVLSKVDNEFWGVQRFIADILAFEEGITKNGIQAESINFLKRLKITIDPDVKKPKWLSQKGTPVLYYSNHEALIDPIFMGAFMDRDDLAILGTNILSKIGPNAKKYILPLMARKYGSDRTDKIGFMHKILERGQGLTAKDIENMNQNTLELSVKKLTKDNHAVGVFPSGAAENIKHWYNGIGRIVSMISDEDRKRILLSPIFFHGVKRENILLIINKVYAKMRNGFDPQTLSADFGEVRPMFKVVGSEKDPKKITEMLRDDYFKQFELQPKYQPS